MLHSPCQELCDTIVSFSVPCVFESDNITFFFVRLDIFCSLLCMMTCISEYEPVSILYFQSLWDVENAFFDMVKKEIMTFTLLFLAA